MSKCSTGPALEHFEEVILAMALKPKILAIVNIEVALWWYDDEWLFLV